MTWHGSSYWDFATRFYAQPGVEKACLELQEEGNDILLLLLACWLGAQGQTIDVGLGQRMQFVARRWNSDVVSPLRRARRSLPAAAEPASQADPAVGGLRRSIAAVELDAERLAMVDLEYLARSAGPSPVARLTDIILANARVLGLGVQSPSSEPWRLILRTAEGIDDGFLTTSG